MSAIPDAWASLWSDLVTGKISYKFELFAANMAVARAIRVVAADPAQKQAMIQELVSFFTKYAALTAADLTRLK